MAQCAHISLRDGMARGRVSRLHRGIPGFDRGHGRGSLHCFRSRRGLIGCGRSRRRGSGSQRGFRSRCRLISQARPRHPGGNNRICRIRVGVPAKVGRTQSCQKCPARAYRNDKDGEEKAYSASPAGASCIVFAGRNRVGLDRRLARRRARPRPVGRAACPRGAETVPKGSIQCQAARLGLRVMQNLCP